MKLNQIDYQQYRRYYQVVSDVSKRPHTHLYTTVAFTFLAISLFAWYAIRPTVQTILFLKREIADKTEVNQKMEEKIAALITAQDALAQIEPNLPVLSEALPSSPDVVSVMSQLRSLALLTQASISSIRTADVPVAGEASTSGAAQKSEALGELAYTITATGAFGQLESFLRGMIDMRRIITINAMSFSPNETQTSQESNAPLEMVVKIRSFYIPEDHAK